MAAMTSDERTYTPQIIMDAYRKSFASIHHCEPHIANAGNGWYWVNGELVDRDALFLEISRLRDLEQRQNSLERAGLVRRLIAKLRGI